MKISVWRAHRDIGDQRVSAMIVRVYLIKSNLNVFSLLTGVSNYNRSPTNFFLPSACQFLTPKDETSFSII